MDNSERFHCRTALTLLVEADRLQLVRISKLTLWVRHNPFSVLCLFVCLSLDHAVPVNMCVIGLVDFD